jgi:hypothetical protein
MQQVSCWNRNRLNMSCELGTFLFIYMQDATIAQEKSGLYRYREAICAANQRGRIIYTVWDGLFVNVWDLGFLE